MKRTIAILSLLLVGFNLPAGGNLGLHTVVIDAGHGGKDPGAVSKDHITYEKTITLDIANTLATKIAGAYPDIKVVRTRPDDKFVSLASRAEIANKVNGDIFISIHINSAKSTQPSGYSIHVLGDSNVKNRDLFAYNMDVCQRENSVILLEEDYTTRYQGFNPNDPESFIFMQLMQNSHLEQSLDVAQMIGNSLKASPLAADRGVWQNPFYVLWKTSMPSVLVELGFLSNQGDLSVLRSKASRDKIAECIFEAFCKYKKAYDLSITIDTPSAGDSGIVTTVSPETREPKPASPQKVDKTVDKKIVVSPENPAILYGTQILAGKNLLSAKDKAFLGYKVRILKVNGLYKYVIGTSTDLSIARQNFASIRKKYPGAFMVSINGEIVGKIN